MEKLPAKYYIFHAGSATGAKRSLSAFFRCKGPRYLESAPRVQEMLRQIRMILDMSEKSEAMAMREARKHALWYLRGYPGAAAFRARSAGLCTYADAEALAADYLAYRASRSK